ncbi:hypothetical protein MMIC_P0311 [Mariprofundus micogutta]|uniref:Uncharacterized protein n=1 Tax=Mariprofundus micogutta TaxID=1921010 RepID=A0A1L8CKD7_9PROT|nr:hypothetical protein [Mariprofundus micogutta]GAV19377.1 hypothetical protein MMIC_P0311 [Mariprofundus micogutta]
MPIDWDAMGDAVDTAAIETDEQLASKISSLTRMNDEEIQDLFPEKADKQKLIELMQLVNASTDENTRTVRLVDNIQDLAGTAVKLLARFV